MNVPRNNWHPSSSKNVWKDNTVKQSSVWKALLQPRIHFNLMLHSRPVQCNTSISTKSTAQNTTPKSHKWFQKTNVLEPMQAKKVHDKIKDTKWRKSENALCVNTDMPLSATLELHICDGHSLKCHRVCLDLKTLAWPSSSQKSNCFKFWKRLVKPFKGDRTWQICKEKLNLLELLKI